MPRTDLAYQELLTYAPAVEPPPDLEDFWRATLDELAGVPPEVKLNASGPSLRGVSCAAIAFRSFAGARVRGWYLRPRDGQVFPGVVVYHGYGGRGARPLELYPLAAQGVKFLDIGVNGASTTAERTVPRTTSLS